VGGESVRVVVMWPGWGLGVLLGLVCGEGAGDGFIAVVMWPGWGLGVLLGLVCGEGAGDEFIAVVMWPGWGLGVLLGLVCGEGAGDGVYSCLYCGGKWGRVEWLELCCGIQCLWSEEHVEGPREGQGMKGGGDL